jgi:Na+/H+ antiporter NhaD/arsenite permease-like protein
MAITLDITGILQAAAFWVSNRGGSNGRKLYLYFYIMLTLISMVLGNDPVILSGTVFLVYYTAATHLEPLAWLMSEFAAANTASMVLFVGNPTNVVICEGFSINNAAFTAYTILPFVACNVFCFVGLAIQFRSPKYIPPKLNITGQLNVREVLRDPVGAIVGSITLGSCLIVALVLSFLHIDVWKIMLPFAVFKFIFDMCWDHYRFINNKLPKEDQAAEEEAVKHALQRAATALTIPDHLHPDRESTLATEVLPGKHTITEEPSPIDRSPSSTLNPVLIPEGKSISPHKYSGPFAKQQACLGAKYRSLAKHFPTFFTALPRLPFALVPFAFSQFILIEALTRQGWIEVFGRWLAIASGGEMFSTIWLVGVMGVILCNIAGTNIGATIFLTKIIHQAQLSAPAEKGAAIALAVASNIGAVSFTFSASLAGLLWKAILEQKGIKVKQWEFAMWNSFPLLVMTTVGLAIVCAEMAVLY